jgi:signal transduction histidine kinase
MAAAEKASQAKSEFLARMSHELRTPVNSLADSSQAPGRTTRAEICRPRQVQFAPSIRRRRMDLLHLINDILDLSRIESGAVTISNLEVPSASAVRDYLESNFRRWPSTRACLLDHDRRAPAGDDGNGRAPPAADSEEPAVERFQVHQGGRRVAAIRTGSRAAPARSPSP